VQILVFGCAYEKIADEACSASTLRRRRDEWIGAGVVDALREMALEAYYRMIGLELSDVAVDCCITKAPCGGEKAGKSPVDRGKEGIKRSVAVDGRGIPLGALTATANRHDSLLLVPTLEAVRTPGPAAGGSDRPPGSRLRLGGYPPAPARARARRRNLRERANPRP
jgi:hypothetical protein